MLPRKSLDSSADSSFQSTRLCRDQEGVTAMPAEYEIRAAFDASTLVVYQAYRPEIALPAVAHQRFVPPFSLGRMTWIKPSFLWIVPPNFIAPLILVRLFRCYRFL